MTFRSAHHPAGTSRALLVVQAQAHPVAWALLAVMTVGLAAALLGNAILWPFVAGAAAAYGLAAAYGVGTLHRRLAEVEVRGPFAAVRSVWEAATVPPPHRLLPVVSARVAYGELTVGLGDAVVSFDRAEWPDFDGLADAFRQSARECQALIEHSELQ